MSKPDEKAIERDYCAGVLSQQGVADKYGITLKALRYMAQKNGWVRHKVQKGKDNKQGQKVGAKKNFAPGNHNWPEAAPALNMPAENQGQNSLRADPVRSHFCPELTDKESLFVSYYLECRNKYEAYRKAGYTGGERNARILYRKPAVARAINQGIEQLTEQAILNAQDILRHWHEIAIADPGEISQMRRVCCRYCWGFDNRYQWIDETEYDKAAAKAANDNKPPPDQSGGFGFVANDDPNPDCPKCAGEGIEDVFLADTRDLVGPARRLIAGVKKTKFGIEVMTRDQDAALRNLAAFHNLASSEQDRELRLLEIERVRLSNEKIKAEIEHLRSGDSNDTIVVHGALDTPDGE